jgi:hypothetical protein
MYYETSDFNLAGYLYAIGFKLAAHRADGAQTIFCFDKTDTLLQRVEDYFNLSALINPLRYGSALKIMKNIIYQKNNNYKYDNQQFSHQPRRTK